MHHIFCQLRSWFAAVVSRGARHLVFPKRSNQSALVVKGKYPIIDWCSPDFIPVRRPINPIRLFLPVDLVRLAIELDEKHQVPRQESTPNQCSILIAPAVAKDREAWGVLVRKVRVGGEECCKDIEYELGYLYCRDIFLPLLGGCQMRSARMRERGARTQIFAPPAVA